jgi:hypothetical protein
VAHEARIAATLPPLPEPPARAAYRAYLLARAQAHGGGGGLTFAGFQTRDGAVKGTRLQCATHACAQASQTARRKRQAVQNETDVTVFFTSVGLEQFRLPFHRRGLNSMAQVRTSAASLPSSSSPPPPAPFFSFKPLAPKAHHFTWVYACLRWRQ